MKDAAHTPFIPINTNFTICLLEGINMINLKDVHKCCTSEDFSESVALSTGFFLCCNIAWEN